MNVERALGYVLVLLFLASVLAVLWQVIGRYVLQSPSSVTEEISRFLLIWLGMLSTAYAFARRMHVGVDLMSAMLSERARKVVGKAIWSACTAFAILVLVYGGGRLVNITATLGQTSAALNLPMWVIYTVLPISGVLITYFALSFLLQADPVDTIDPLEAAND
ncbi:TRAP transporter small permease [Parasphingorhabdus cellanae]|uniref:TRAP transporter small permease protein n=1 Tax=Parasphingorhabdus cellanae TaxID=2806553 RepID=A0ABX7T5W6_9SPHN|nr:TRAP transporter small permease [Parasphingorhabdus cellanae]QTD55859.1 TRAP transporter small permease [Parasphingorhabdus cellanae]